MHERYRLRRLFAQGGMAEVYLGAAVGAEGFEKPVAIKRILPHLAKDEAIARMFLSEAKLATYLSHQNIVQVFDVGRGPDGLFIVMELVNGWDLGVVIDEAVKANLTLSPALAAFVVSQALAGLCHAYRQNHLGKPIIVAHRDISASNILVSAEGEVKVADFGIARLQESANHTEPGTFKGKIAYAAPEVLRGQPATKASDQFAVGIVLHEMLTGQHPFGRLDNSMAYVDAIVNRPPAEVPGLPPRLGDILRRVLSKSPHDRFESPEVFARAVAQFLASTGTPSTTHELAEFTRRLDMPKLPSELASQDTVIRERLPGSFSLKSMPSLEGVKAVEAVAGSAANASWQAAEIEALQKDWKPVGPELDSSGQMYGEQPMQPSASVNRASSPATTGPRPLDEVQVIELARAPNAKGFVPQSSEQGDAAPSEHLVPLDSALQLQQMEGRRFSPPRFAKWVALSAVVGAVATAAAIKWPQVYPLVFRVKIPQISALVLRKVRGSAERSGPAPILKIESEPTGARIQIGDEEVGETPLFIENLYPATEIAVKLSLKGYQPWTGKFSGGQPAAVTATLKRRR